jgi:hypothetical protein
MKEVDAREIAVDILEQNDEFFGHLESRNEINDKKILKRS